MAGVEGRGFSERGVIAAGRVHRAQPADKLHAHALLHFFNLAQQDAADLSRGADMRTTAGCEIEISNIDQAEIASLLWWKLAQAELPRFLQWHKANADGPVFGNHFIRQLLCLLRLRLGKT